MTGCELDTGRPNTGLSLVQSCMNLSYFEQDLVQSQTFHEYYSVTEDIGKVRGGDTYIVSSTGILETIEPGSTFIVENGGTVVATGGNNTAYLKAGAKFVAGGGGNNLIYYEQGADITNPGSSAQLIEVSLLTLESCELASLCAEVTFLDTSVERFDLFGYLEINDLYITGAGSQKYVINSGGVLDSGGGSNTIFVRAGGSVLSAGGSNTVYLESGASFDAGGGGSNTIYYQSGANIINAGGSAVLVEVRSVTIGSCEILSPTILDVTVNQSPGQMDPTGSAFIQFDVQFSNPVTGFNISDIVFSGTASEITFVITGSGQDYMISVSSILQAGTVVPSIPAGAAKDRFGNLNTASTSMDNNVTYVYSNPSSSTLCSTVTHLDSSVQNFNLSGYLELSDLYITGAGSQNYVINSGGVLDSGGGSNTIFVRAGGSVLSAGGSNTVYLESGASFDAGGGGSNTIYYQSGANIINAGGSAVLVEISFLTFANCP